MHHPGHRPSPRQTRRRQVGLRGVALVEFALVLPMLLLLIFTVVELGRALYQYNTLTKSVRLAARYLSEQQPGTHIAQARNLIVYGNAAGSGAPLALGLEPAMVPDPQWRTAGNNPVINTVTVRISGYRFTSVFASAFGYTFGTIPYADITATMRSPL